MKCEHEIDLQDCSPAERESLRAAGRRVEVPTHRVTSGEYRRFCRCPEEATWFAVAPNSRVRLPRCNYHGYTEYLTLDAVKPHCLPISEWDTVGRADRVLTWAHQTALVRKQA